MYIIYKYTNVVNGKVYIGQTSKALKERAQACGRNYRECRRFYNAIQKYSWDAFVPEVIEIVSTVDEANEREIYYISKYNSTDENYGYNLAQGGNNKTMLPESKKLISDKAVVRYKNKAANPMYGKKHAEHTLELQRLKKIGANNPMYGTKWTSAQRDHSGCRGMHLNISDARRDELRKHGVLIGKTVGLRPVRCVEDGTEFVSITDAANTYGVSKSTICGHLTGKQKSCCGKHFEYIN